MNELEDGLSLTLDWSKLAKIGATGSLVVPVVIQEADTSEVLYVAYAHEEALAATIERKEAVLWSTSRNELWHKGATSGDTLAMVDIRVNCEQNSLLYLVRRTGTGACHTRETDGTPRGGCYYRSLALDNGQGGQGGHGALSWVAAPSGARPISVTGARPDVPETDARLAREAVNDAVAGFRALAGCSDEQITAFFHRFADRLADDVLWVPVLAANATDLDAARVAGRSTTRLQLSPAMRAGMIAGLRGWAETAGGRDQLVETVTHKGWRVEQRRAPLGVVAFVFEGRPNVFADACGVLRGGNSVVFRIGSDALGTARAIVAQALAPALVETGLPSGAVRLLDSPSRTAGRALFADSRLGLAVARGSGEAVAQLGAIARKAGVPVSLHGTGGAWLVAGDGARSADFEAAVVASLDRKVCNTLNVCVIPAGRATELVPVFVRACEAAGVGRSNATKLHVTASAKPFFDPALFDETIVVPRAAGLCTETRVSTIEADDLGTEWEWEDSPEVSLVVVDCLDDAIELCNRLSPRLVATLISDDAAEHEQFWTRIEAPFVGNGFTRWVDGQFALGKPELGLSNWQHGRLFARSAVLSGDSVFTVRTRMIQSDPTLHR